MWTLLLLLAGAPAHAADRPPGWDAQHPVSLGVHALSWHGAYTAAGVGGHLQIRPWRRLGLQLFNDNSLALRPTVAQHDHVIGFHVFTPLLDTQAISVSPTLGMCADFSFATPRNADAVGTQDIRFGGHLGALVEVHVGGGFSFVGQATLTAYAGHDTHAEGWTASLSNKLTVAPVGVLKMGASYAF